MLLLYNPPSSATRKPVLPMSLLALGALLEGEQEYAILDGNLEDDPAGRIDAMAARGEIDVLGVTVMPGPQLHAAAPLCRRLKERHPALKIVWGGYFPSQHYQACLRSGYVDYVIRGCGERAFPELLRAARGGAAVDSIPALAFVDPASGEIVARPPGEIPHPEELPDFPYHRIETERYLRPTFMGERTISHHSSYGCPYSCDFCSVAVLAQGRWRAQSAERLAGVVEGLVERFGADSVEFHDNSFFIDEGRVAQFAERIRPLGIGWWAEARIDRLADYDDATWRLMRDSGLRMVFMGAETGSDETLARMNKGGTASTEQTLRVARRAREWGVVPELSFVLGNPPDPEGDVARTLEFIREVKRVNPAAEIIFYMYTPVPSAGELFDQARQQGFRFPDTLEEWTGPAWRGFSQRRDVRVPWLEPRLRRRVRDFETVLNAFYPTVTDRRLRGALRLLLRMAGGWRYKLRFHAFPIELRVLQKLLSYQRPETSGL